MTETDLSAVAVTIGPGLSLCLRGTLMFEHKATFCCIELPSELNLNAMNYEIRKGFL